MKLMKDYLTPKKVCLSLCTMKYRTRAIISRGLYIFYPIFSAVYIQKRLILQTVYVLKSGNSSKISAVYNQERFQIKSGL